MEGFVINDVMMDRDGHMWFSTKDNGLFFVSQTLFEYEKHLSEHGFFRVHHKHLINLKQANEMLERTPGWLMR